MIKKSFYNILWCAGVIVACTFSACSEDSLTPMDELGKTIYDPANAEAGTTDASINTFYNKYGSKILYTFNASDLTFGWSGGKTNYWYAPVKEQYRHYVDDVVKYLHEKAFQGYPDEFIKRFLPYRIFLVEQICDSKTYDVKRLQDVLKLTTHGIAIANIGEKMNEWSEKDWDKLKSNVVELIMSSIASSFPNNYILTGFDGLRPPYLWAIEISSDPENEFTDIEYSLYSNGMAGGAVDLDWGMIAPPTALAPDLGQFITLVLSTPKTKMDRICLRFPLLKQRLFLVAEFIKDVLEMDPIAMQNGSCPNDPYPADYFKK